MPQHHSAATAITTASSAPPPRVAASAKAIGGCHCHASQSPDFGFSTLQVLAGAGAELEVSRPGDPDELEADRVAEAILARAPSATEMPVAVAPCPACAGAVHRKCTKCRDEEEHKRVQRTPSSTAPQPMSSTGLQLSRGTPMPRSVRNEFEARFAHDFGRVRVHTDTRAAEAARGLSARAFTIGTEVAFGSGEFQPGTAAGRRLIAHELTHVIQQCGGASGSGVSTPRVNRLRVQREGTEVPPTGFGMDTKYLRCSEDTSREVQYEIELARLHVNGAAAGLAEELAKIEAPNPGAGIITIVGGALDRYFKTREPAKVKYILARLESIAKWLDRGPSNWTCLTQQQCDGYCAGTGASACASPTSPVALCDNYFQETNHTERSMVLVHEAAHQAGLPGDVYSHNKKFPDLSSQQAMGNADSYAFFVQETALGGLPAQPSDQRLIEWSPKLIGAMVHLRVPAPGGTAATDGYSRTHLSRKKLKVTNLLEGEFLFHIDVQGFPRPMIFRAPRIKARITLQRTAPAGAKPQVLFWKEEAEGIYQGDGAPLGPGFEFDLPFDKSDAGVLTLEAWSVDLDAKIERTLTETLEVNP